MSTGCTVCTMALFRTAGEALTLALPAIRATWSLYNTAGQSLLAATLALCVSIASVVAVIFHTDNTDDQTATTTATAPTSASCSSTTPTPASLAAASSSEAPAEARAAVDGGPMSSVQCGHEEPSLPGGDIQTGHYAGVTAVDQQQQHITAVENGGGDSKAHDLQPHGDPATQVYTTRRRPAEFKDQSHNTSNAGILAISTPTHTPTKRSRSYRRGGEVLYIAEGVAEAVVGIVRDPVKGAQGDGARGLVKGIGSGVVGVVVRPVRGVARAGQNAYNGVRIGVARARGGTRGSNSSSNKV